MKHTQHSDESNDVEKHPYTCSIVTGQNIINLKLKQAVKI